MTFRDLEEFFDWVDEAVLESGIYEAQVLGGSIVEGRYGKQLEVRLQLLGRYVDAGWVKLPQPVERRMWISLRPRALEEARKAGVVRRREDGKGEIAVGSKVTVLLTANGRLRLP